MEYIARNGELKSVIARYKAVSDGEGGVRNVSLRIVYRCIGGALKVIWMAMRSCFGSGYWQNDLPWDNDYGWNNG